jgi:methylenetetrahydrofolate reductase (NADPH)
MRLPEVFERPGRVFSFEFFPPKTEAGIARLYATIEHMAELSPAFVSVTYGAMGSSRRTTVEIASEIRRRFGIEPLVHLTCVDQSRAEVALVLDRLEEAGLHNVLALRGDPPRGSGRFLPRPDGFAHASELVAFVRARGGFAIAAACHPEGHVESPGLDADVAHLAHKVGQGVDFLITQLFFENSAYFRFVERARSAGVGVPILPGLMPVTNVSQLERFTDMCGATVPAGLRSRLERVRDDPQAVMAIGIEWCIRQARELLAAGAPGVHFYTLNQSLATRVVHFAL